MHLLRRAEPASTASDVSHLGGGDALSLSVPSKTAESWTAGAIDSSLELWSTKHPPTSEGTIVVAKKKLDTLRAWLRAWEVPPMASTTEESPNAPKVLLLVGPPGCGKSAAVKLIANEQGREILEWKPPVPTLWEEHKHLSHNHNAGTGGNYMSKLDDFAAFVQRASLYAPLAFAPSASADVATGTGASNSGTTGNGTQSTLPVSKNKTIKPPILSVEDLPAGAGEEAARRAVDLLIRLTRESRVPAVVTVSEEDAGGVGGLAGGGGGGSDGKQNQKSFTQGLSARLIVHEMERNGALVVTFNPATTPKLAKALAAVAAAENVDVAADRLLAIAVAAEGDVRCALASLQMFAAGRGLISKPVDTKNKAKAKGGKKRGRGEAVETDSRKTAENLVGDENAANGARRDRGLSMFHALGKILYNKRDETGGDLLGEEKTRNRMDTGTAIGEETRNQETSGDTNTETSGGDASNVRDKAPSLGGDDKSTPFTSGKPTRTNDGTLRFGDAVPCFTLHANFTRGVTKYDPEDILQRAKFGSDRATTFLFENFPEGLRDDAVFDAAIGTGYLSDACWFASAGRRLAGSQFGFGGGGSGDNNQHLVDGDGAPADPGAVGELVAGSVATRGLLFAPHPTRPSLRGFRAFKGPNSAKAQRAAAANLREVRAVVAAAAGGDFAVGSDRTAAAAETLPMLRVIAGCGPEGAARVPFLPTRWVKVGEDPTRVGGVGGLPPGVRCAPRPDGKTVEIVRRVVKNTPGTLAAMEDEDEDQGEDDEIEEW